MSSAASASRSRTGAETIQPMSFELPDPAPATSRRPESSSSLRLYSCFADDDTFSPDPAGLGAASRVQVQVPQRPSAPPRAGLPLVNISRQVGTLMPDFPSAPAPGLPLRRLPVASLGASPEECGPPGACQPPQPPAVLAVSLRPALRAEAGIFQPKGGVAASSTASAAVSVQAMPAPWYAAAPPHLGPTSGFPNPLEVHAANVPGYPAMAGGPCMPAGAPDGHARYVGTGAFPSWGMGPNGACVQGMWGWPAACGSAATCASWPGYMAAYGAGGAPAGARAVAYDVGAFIGAGAVGVNLG